MTFSYSSNEKSRINRLIKENIKIREKIEIENTPFYNMKIPGAVARELLNEPPYFEFSTNRIIRLVPGLATFLRFLILILFKIQKKLNRNRDILLLSLVSMDSIEHESYPDTD